MLPPPAWSTTLQRTFATFPAGSVGAALLVLRVNVGASAIIEAGLAVMAGHSLLNLAVASVVVAAGLALIIGLLTPVAGAVLASGAAAILIGPDGAGLRLLDSRMALFEFVVMAVLTVILGPGAASIDAHLFGRREVRIRAEHRPNDL
jgi:putative oxidoreductase